MTATSRILSLDVADFRNLETGPFVPAKGFNLVVGENGHGKTNLLEALYVGLTTKSFRAHKLGETIARGKEAARVRVRIEADGITREQRANLGFSGRSFLIDEKRPDTYATYASKTPLVLFHPGELELSQGGGAHRRKLLDRLLLYVAPMATSALTAYAKVLRERQSLLEEGTAGDRELVTFEELLVRYGREVERARREIFGLLAPQAVAAFRRFGSPGKMLALDYLTNVPEDDEAYLRMLRVNRSVDARRSSASIGPHRDDLVLSLDGAHARGFASQGQHRALVMALKMAEVGVLEAKYGTAPIFLLDDLSSEFDAARLTALLEALAERDAQMFVTSTRKELFAEALRHEDARAFEMTNGHLETVSGA